MEPEDENSIVPTRSLFSGAMAINPANDAEGSELEANNADQVVPVEQEEDTELVDAVPPVENLPEATELAVAELEEVVVEDATTEEATPVVEATEEVAEAESEEVEEPAVKTEIELLVEQQEAITKKLQEKRDEERRSVLSQIAAICKLYAITVTEVANALGGVPNPRKGEKAPITHRDTKGNTWTGRGKTPKWLKGLNPDDYRV